MISCCLWLQLLSLHLWLLNKKLLFGTTVNCENKQKVFSWSCDHLSFWQLCKAKTPKCQRPWDPRAEVCPNKEQKKVDSSEKCRIFITVSFAWIHHCPADLYCRGETFTQTKNRLFLQLVDAVTQPEHSHNLALGYSCRSFLLLFCWRFPRKHLHVQVWLHLPEKLK